MLPIMLEVSMKATHWYTTVTACGQSATYLLLIVTVKQPSFVDESQNAKGYFNLTVKVTHLLILIRIATSVYFL